MAARPLPVGDEYLLLGAIEPVPPKHLAQVEAALAGGDGSAILEALTLRFA
ncbi:MAG: hypothetical protein GX542_11500 [Rhodococcus sp.]|nr:hypothetical protein [Rhodococcus sp. (in: high G+C Gram-positive bacteria)]